MTLVEVLVPAMGQRYDFELEDSVSVEVLIREMAAVICQKEHLQSPDEGGLLQNLSLYSQPLERRLSPTATLRQSGVMNGQVLILV